MLLFLSSALGQQLLVPEFTPESVTDFTVTYMMYDQLLRDMRARGMEPIDGDAIRAQVGDVAEECSSNPECVPALLEAYPGVALVVVGEVGTTNDGLEVQVRYYVRDDPEAVKTRQHVLEPGAELAFPAEVADQSGDLLSIVTMFQPSDPVELPDEPQPVEPDEPVIAAPADPDEPSIYEPTVEDPLTGPSERPAPGERPAPSARPDPTGPPKLGEKAEKRKMGVSKRNYQRYLDSGMERQAWMEQNRVRTATFSLELGGGYSSGSIDRQYDVVLVLEEGANGTFVEQERWEQDVLTNGTGGFAMAGFSVGLTANLELGLAGGVQFAHKRHLKGWEHHENGSPVDEYRLEYDPVAALVALVEPRLRVYTVQRGPVKPYLLGVGQLRIYDGYEVEDTPQVDYPNRAPMYPFAVGGGPGVMFDISPGFSLFVEAPYARMVFGADGYRKDAPSLQNAPVVMEESFDGWRVHAGLGLKF